jgi:hypothetical protein
VSFLNELLKYTRLPEVRTILAVAAFAAITVVTIATARYQMFTTVASYQDEGYMLVALKSFVNHGSLYDYVFTQYGPFFYEFWGGIFSLFDIPVVQSSGRDAVLVVWVLTSLVSGVTMLRITGSILLGLATQALVFPALSVFANEPMHPGSLICLLLATILGLACFFRLRPSLWSAALLGATVAALVLVKINVGAFALAALLLSCVVVYPALDARRWLRIVVEAGVVLFPFVLMAAELGESWALHYAVHVAVAMLAIVIVLRTRSFEPRANQELLWLGGGFVAMVVVVCGAILATGTSVSGLIEGVITQPLRQSDAFKIPMVLADRVYAFDLLALAGAAGYWFTTRRGARPGTLWQALIGALSILIGVEMALSVIGKTFPADTLTVPGYQFSFLAFAWLALAPVPGEDRPTAFARLLLPSLAVLQAMHAFPVAGSQVLWSTFLLIPVGALCVANGVRQLASLTGAGNERWALAAIGGLTAVFLVGFIVNTALQVPLKTARATYESRVALDLPGSARIHLSPEEVDLFRSITAEIDRNCDSMLQLPGMGNFYIWSEQEPPTGYVATAWPTLFDDAHQEKVVEQTRSIRGLCLLRNVGIAEGWSAGPVPDGPLVSYLEEGFELIVNIEGYELLKRPGTGRPS